MGTIRDSVESGSNAGSNSGLKTDAAVAYSADTSGEHNHALAAEAASAYASKQNQTWSLTGEALKLTEADETGRAKRGVPGALDGYTYTPVETSFNGPNLCHSLRGEMERYHRRLQDPDTRLKFQKYWTDTCDNNPALATESGADKVVKGMLLSMNERFDHYFDRQGYAGLQRALAGSDIGIGIDTEVRDAGSFRSPQPYEAYISKDHPLEVRSVTPGGPADQAGLKVGDRIEAINGVPTEGKKRRDALAETEGTDGASVHISVARPQDNGTFERKEFDTREKLVVEDTAQYSSLGDGVGYIKLRNFIADDAGDKMFWALGQTRDDKAIIIDLRNNGGGKLTNLDQIAQLIMEKGSLYREEVRSGDSLKTETRTLTSSDLIFTSTLSDHPETAEKLISPRRAERIVPEDKPIVVLVDEYSASASEILAGALQANKRAILVGVPTTGKSEGQQLVPLPFDRGAAITDFEFYPGDRPVPHSGLKPDITAARGNDARVDDQLAAAKKAALALTAAGRP